METPTPDQIEAQYGIPAGTVSVSRIGDVVTIDYGDTLAGRKAAKIAELAAARYAEETGGITLNGSPLATGRGDQAMLNGAWVFTQANPDATIRWKGPTGWVDLDAAQVAGIASAVGAHVQACFAREGELAEMVLAAETEEEVTAITWSFPAPE